MAITLVSEYETPTYIESGGTAGVTVTTGVGDTLVVVATSGNSGVSYTGITGGGLTYTFTQSVSIPNRATTTLWTAPSSSAQTFVLSMNISVGVFGFNVLRFSGVGSIGASNQSDGATGAGTLSLTTTAVNSAIVAMIGDWDGADGSTRAWDTGTAGSFTEQTYYRDPANITAYGGWYPNAGAIGAKTVGLTTPASLNHAVVAVELTPQVLTAPGFRPVVAPMRATHRALF